MLVLRTVEPHRRREGRADQELRRRRAPGSKASATIARPLGRDEPDASFLEVPPSYGVTIPLPPSHGPQSNATTRQRANGRAGGTRPCSASRWRRRSPPARRGRSTPAADEKRTMKRRSCSTAASRVRSPRTLGTKTRSKSAALLSSSAGPPLPLPRGGCPRRHRPGERWPAPGARPARRPRRRRRGTRPRLPPATASSVDSISSCARICSYRSGSRGASRVRRHARERQARRRASASARPRR